MRVWTEAFADVYHAAQCFTSAWTVMRLPSYRENSAVQLPMMKARMNLECALAVYKVELKRRLT
jgi:hypothetical protein